MIDSARIESDEDGFRLVLDGDFVEEFERYLDSETTSVSIRIPADEAERLLRTLRETVEPWAAERDAERDEYESRRSVADDRDALDPRDPKHPDYADTMLDAGAELANLRS